MSILDFDADKAKALTAVKADEKQLVKILTKIKVKTEKGNTLNVLEPLNSNVATALRSKGFNIQDVDNDYVRKTEGVYHIIGW